MKSKTKKRVAAVAIGTAALVQAGYALSQYQPKPPASNAKPSMFNADTPFFTEGMDVAVPSSHRPQRKRLPATKWMFGNERYSQYKVLGKVDDALYQAHTRVRPMANKPTRLSKRGGAFVLQAPTKFQRSQFPRSATVFSTGAW